MGRQPHSPQKERKKKKRERRREEEERREINKDERVELLDVSF